MKNSKFTPGPWEVIDESDGEVLSLQPMSIQLTVYDSTDVETNRANARLIAAAPELYELATEIVRAFNFGDKITDYVHEDIFYAVQASKMLLRKIDGAE